MEAVGARLGRSSTRYGPATVFNGPVRRWKKQWVHVRPSNSSSNSNNHHHHTHHQTANNGTANGSNGSHLLLFKWTAITPSQNNGNGNSSNGDVDVDVKKDDVVATKEPPRRKFKYMPIAVLEEQKREVAEQTEDEAKPSDTDMNEADPASQNGADEKPDINDVPKDENQTSENNTLARQDLNESTLDLSLGLKAHDSDNDPDSNTDQIQDGKLERLNSIRS